MPIYISRGRFTTDAVKGMMANPENREEAVSALFKSVGGKLISWYLTFGPMIGWSLANSLTTKPQPLRCWPLPRGVVSPTSRRRSP
jgi:hypothetical protein